MEMRERSIEKERKDTIDDKSEETSKKKSLKKKNNLDNEKNKEMSTEIPQEESKNKSLRCLNCFSIPLIFLNHTTHTVKINCNLGHNISMDIKDYLEKGYSNNFYNQICSQCKSKIDYLNERKNYYCKECNEIFCKNCIKSHNLIFNNNNDSQSLVHHYINLEKYDTTCVLHNETYDYYCLECNKNICQYCYYSQHKVHKIVDLDEIILRRKELKRIRDNFNLEKENLALANQIIKKLLVKIKRETNKILEYKEAELKFKESIIKIYERKVDNYNIIKNMRNLLFNTSPFNIDKNTTYIDQLNFFYDYITKDLAKLNQETFSKKSYSSINSRFTNDNKSNSREPEKKSQNNDDKNEFQNNIDNENNEIHNKNKVKSYDKTKRSKKIVKKDRKKDDHINYEKRNTVDLNDSESLLDNYSNKYVENKKIKNLKKVTKIHNIKDLNKNDIPNSNSQRNSVNEYDFTNLKNNNDTYDNYDNNNKLEHEEINDYKNKIKYQRHKKINENKEKDRELSILTSPSEKENTINTNDSLKVEKFEVSKTDEKDKNNIVENEKNEGEKTKKKKKVIKKKTKKIKKKIAKEENDTVSEGSSNIASSRGLKNTNKNNTSRSPDNSSKKDNYEKVSDIKGEIEIEKEKEEEKEIKKDREKANEQHKEQKEIEKERKKQKEKDRKRDKEKEKEKEKDEKEKEKSKEKDNNQKENSNQVYKKIHLNMNSNYVKDKNDIKNKTNKPKALNKINNDIYKIEEYNKNNSHDNIDNKEDDITAQDNKISKSNSNLIDINTKKNIMNNIKEKKPDLKKHFDLFGMFRHKKIYSKSSKRNSISTLYMNNSVDEFYFHFNNLNESIKEDKKRIQKIFRDPSFEKKRGSLLNNSATFNLSGSFSAKHLRLFNFMGQKLNKDLTSEFSTENNDNSNKKQNNDNNNNENENKSNKKEDNNNNLENKDKIKNEKNESKEESSINNNQSSNIKDDLSSSNNNNDTSNSKQFSNINDVTPIEDKEFYLSDGITLNEFKTKTLRLTVKEYENTVYSLLEINSSIFAVGFLNGEIDIYDTNDIICLFSIIEHNSRINNMYLLKEPNTFLSSSFDYTMKKIKIIEENKTYVVEFTFDGYENIIYKGIELHNGHIISISFGGILKIWNKLTDKAYLQNQKQLIENEELYDIIEINNKIIAISTDENLHFFNINTNKNEILTHHKKISDIEFKNRNNMVLMDSNILGILLKNEIGLVDVNHKQIIHKCNIFGGKPETITLMKDKTILISVSNYNIKDYDDESEDKNNLNKINKITFLQYELVNNGLNFLIKKEEVSDKINSKDYCRITSVVEFANGIIAFSTSGMEDNKLCGTVSAFDY